MNLTPKPILQAPAAHEPVPEAPSYSPHTLIVKT